MSDRVRELAERQVALQLRCAFQRRAVAQEVRSIEARFDSVDRAVKVARGVLRNPAVIAGGVIALLVLGRLRGCVCSVMRCCWLRARAGRCRRSSASDFFHAFYFYAGPC
jgi:hypothetical protein